MTRKRPALAVPRHDPALVQFLEAVKERLEIMDGARGDALDRAVTLRELQELGVGLKPSMLLTSNKGIDGVVVSTPSGGMATIPLDHFAESIRSSRLFQSLMRRIGDDTSDSFPDEIRALLSASLAEEAERRGADIATIEHKIQSATRSLAAKVDLVTASVEGSIAGVRDVTYALAEEGRAVAGRTTTIEARIDDVGGATIEEAYLAQADVNDGLLAQYTLKVNAGGAVAGFGVAATETTDGNATSAFIIQADKFAIVGAGYSGGLDTTPAAGQIPFGVDAGTGEVRINGALLVTSSVSTSAITGLAATATNSDYTAVSGTKPPSDADNTTSAIQATTTITGGGITLSGGGNIKGGQTAYATGTGFFLGYSSSAYRLSIGNTTEYIKWDGSSLDMRMSGFRVVTAAAVFEGSSTSGSFGNTSVIANNGAIAANGLIGYAGTSGWGLIGSSSSSGLGGVQGNAAGSLPGVRGGAEAGEGVFGSATTGIGGRFSSVSGIGLWNEGSFKWGSWTYAPPDNDGKLLSDNGTWVAPSALTGVNAASVGGVVASNITRDGTNTGLYVFYGTQTPGSGVATFDGSAKPGGSTTNAWIKVHINGVDYYIPVWTG